MNPAVTVALATLGKVQWKKVRSMSYMATPGGNILLMRSLTTWQVSTWELSLPPSVCSWPTGMLSSGWVDQAQELLVILICIRYEHDRGGYRITPDTAGIFGTYPSHHLTYAGGVGDQVLGTALLLLCVCAITDKRNMQVRGG